MWILKLQWRHVPIRWLWEYNKHRFQWPTNKLPKLQLTVWLSRLIKAELIWKYGVPLHGHLRHWLGDWKRENWRRQLWFSCWQRLPRLYCLQLRLWLSITGCWKCLESFGFWRHFLLGFERLSNNEDASLWICRESVQRRGNWRWNWWIWWAAVN